MAGQSALSSTTSVSVGARLAKPGGSISGANCFEAMRSSFRRRSARSSVTGAGITSPNFLGERNVRLRGSHTWFSGMRQYSDWTITAAAAETGWAEDQASHI